MRVAGCNRPPAGIQEPHWSRLCWASTYRDKNVHISVSRSGFSIESNQPMGWGRGLDSHPRQAFLWFTHTHTEAPAFSRSCSSVTRGPEVQHPVVTFSQICEGTAARPRTVSVFTDERPCPQVTFSFGGGVTIVTVRRHTYYRCMRDKVTCLCIVSTMIIGASLHTYTYFPSACVNMSDAPLRSQESWCWTEL